MTHGSNLQLWMKITCAYALSCIISILGLNVIYSEYAMDDLLVILMQLCETQTIIVLARELWNGNKKQFVVHCSYHSNA